MSVSSLILRSGVASLAALSFFSSPVSAAYKLDTAFSGANFFDGFNFFTDSDPTNGFVTYIDSVNATATQLISSGAGQAAYMGVDSTKYLSPNMTGGRASVRIESKKSWTHALIISDIAHMPAPICGTWPAHWTLGSGVWPANGEVDIIEGVNMATNNLQSMHTTPGCTIAGANELGTLQTNDCDTTKNYNSGCAVLNSASNTYGSGFNQNGGGVFAMEWTSDYVRIWFFPRGSIPADITAGTPNPASTAWGLPQSNFQGSCNIDDKLKDHRIIFDTTFCGDYSGTLFDLPGSACQASTGFSTCKSFVASNPSAFAQAYWSVNSVKVYQSDGVVSTTTTAGVTAPTSLSSVVPQSSVFAPGMGGSNATTTSAPYAVGTVASAVAGTTEPATVGNFVYFGCAGSSSGFATFNQVENSPSMSLDKCIADCGSFAYAGIYNTLCFCANSLDSSTSVAAAKGTCNLPCPGNLNQLCGGSVSSSRMVRQASNGILLSVYANRLIAPIVSVAPIISVAPALVVFAYGMGGGAAVTSTVFSTSYIVVCTQCAGGYSTVYTTTTIGHCGCVGGIPTLQAYGGGVATATFALAAYTTVCGASSTVTLSAPVTAATGLAGVAYVAATTAAVVTVAAGNGTAGATATVTGSVTTYTGAANSLAINGLALLAGVAALVAM